MNEVSCRALGFYFRELRRKKLPPHVLIDGTGYELSHLLDRNERIDWSTFCRFMINVEGVWTDEELIALGGAFLRSPYLRPVIVIARLLYSAMDFYRWTLDHQKGAGRQVFSCIMPSYREVEKNRILADLSLIDGYEPCRGFFVVCKGTFQSVPLMVGEPMATVEMEFTAHGATYDIRVPEGGGSLRWLRRAAMYPFTLRAAARELKEAHEVLVARYKELADARDALERQALQLRTAHRINQAVRGGLDLDHRVEAIADALIDVAKFSAVELCVSAKLDSVRLEKSAARGHGAGTAPLILTLENQDRSLGELQLWPEVSSDVEERRELLEFVVPIVTLALEEAFAYTALSDYRENLELKVQQRTTELIEAQRARDRIFANINHEIRTPLSLILLTVDELQRRKPGTEALAGLSAIERSARQLLRLIEALLLLAARQEEKLMVKRQSLDVCDLFQRIVDLWIPAAESLGVELRYEGPKSLVAALDALAIERIAVNLLSNGLKFTPAGGRVVLSSTWIHDGLEFSVADTGSGIDANVRDRLFGRFEQGESATRSGVRGSGLGLSLVKELVDAHGGNVSVESKPGRGSVFRVRLPCMPDLASILPEHQEAVMRPSDFGHRDPAEAQNEEITGPQNASQTILVAEDNHPLREALGKLLAAHYRVLLAPNGHEALTLARLHQPDLLITDIAMPELDGITLTREWRRLPGNDLAPVILLTAYGGLENRMAGFEAGAIDFVLKPFEPLELLARVRSQLQMRDMALQLVETEKLRAQIAELQVQAAEAKAHETAADAERRQREMSQQFSRNLIDSQEQERKRIAGELHDHIGQEALIIKNHLYFALNDEAVPDETKRRLEKASQVVNSLLGDVRHISYDLRPVQLERVGLTATLREMVQEVFEASVIEPVVTIQTIDHVFQEKDDISVYRIVQEGLNNILKHSQAKRVTIMILNEGDHVMLRLNDDGQGFDVPSSMRSRGIGLRGLTERVQILGGTVRIDSAPGKGANIEIALPIQVKKPEILT